MSDFEKYLILRLQGELLVHGIVMNDENAAACLSGLLFTLVDKSDEWYGPGDLYVLAREFQDFYRKCPYTFAHTRHWCGNPNCRES